MKALGIIRKIDDLGRVVIPKEVRRTQGWEEGCSMEFFMDGNKLVIQSYEGERQKAGAISSLEDLLSRTPNKADRIVLESTLNYIKGDR